MLSVTAATEFRCEHGPDGLRRIDYRSDLDGTADWALLRRARNGGTWIVNIHGHGSHGDQLFVREDIRRLWLPAFLDRGLGLLCPNLRGNAWMSPAAAHDLHALLGLVRSGYGAERFVLFGGSMGGTSNLVYAIRRPEDVAGVAALCAATDPAAYWRWCRTRTEPTKQCPCPTTKLAWPDSCSSSQIREVDSASAGASSASLFAAW